MMNVKEFGQLGNAIDARIFLHQKRQEKGD